MNSLKRTARVSGLLYLVLAITGAYGILYVPSQLLVENDAAQTAANILNNEFFFRSGILANLIGQTSFLFVGLSLYKLFENVNQSLSRMLLILVTVSVPIAFFIIFNQLHALWLMKESFVLDPAQAQFLANSFMNQFQNGNLVIGIFWGLWLIPFGLLSFKSGFIPKAIGVILVLGGLSYVIDAFVFVLTPSMQEFTAIGVAICSSIAEISVLLWLLIVGVREPKLKSIQTS